MTSDNRTNNNAILPDEKFVDVFLKMIKLSLVGQQVFQALQDGPFNLERALLLLFNGVLTM